MSLQITDPQTPAATSKGLVVGIDLGTTRSGAAYVKDGVPHLFDFGLIPSVFQTLSSTKRLMGEGAQPLVVGDQTLTPVEVAAYILARLKTLIEQTGPLEAAVITVPAYFDEAARIATKQAAALAGIKVLRLLNEPTAAALAYGLETGVEGIYAVYDFGGGTFDVSLLKLTQGVFQVLATDGDLQLGGDDIDAALAKVYDISLTKARAAKEALTKNEEFEGITRTDLERIAEPFVTRTLAITKGILHEDIEGIILVGGMTRMPYVRAQVEALFGKAPLTNINPDEAVALGAALSAHALVHGSNTLLLDVTPLSLGLETAGGLVEKIIPRNTPLPALASQEFTTQVDGQGGMVIHVVQGEREFVQDNRSLARFDLRGLPVLAAGAARVRIDFAIDVEGLLTVTALEKTTGVQQHVEVRPSYGLDDNTLQKMLEESQRFGRQDIENRLKVEKTLG